MDELYGLFKKNAADNHFVSLSKALNSAYATKHTSKAMKKIEKYCSHGSNMQIKDGVCYLSYVRNTNAFNDDEFSPYLELVLRTFRLDAALSDNFNIDRDSSLFLIGKIGTELLGERALTCPKGNSMQIIGDELNICTSFLTEDGRYKLFSIVFDTKTKTSTRQSKIKLRYSGKLYDMNDETINMIYKSVGKEPTDESILETVSPWNEYRGEYYSTFVIAGQVSNGGVVVKTRDFETMELVSVIPNNDNGCAEAISIIYDGKLFVACRQKWTLPYMLLMRYDIDDGIWHEPYRIEDANARPWMFIHKNELYLYNTIDEGFRQYSNISKIRTSNQAHNGKNHPIDTIATLYDCGAYSCIRSIGERLFFASSKDGYVHFGELFLKEYSPTSVNDVLLSLLGDADTTKQSDFIAIGADKNSQEVI